MSTPTLTATRLRLVTFLVTGALFMEVLDGTIIATALPEMARSFGIPAVELNIGISAYLFSLGIFIPVSGWIADRLGPRSVFATAVALFTLASGIDPVNLGLLGGGLVFVLAALRHFRRSARPMLDLSSFRITTFRVSMIGGSISRMGIGSLPFLLPVMFQAGFGMDAFQSGLLLLVVFAENLGMKAVTTPILRRFGYRPVLIWNGLFAAASLAAAQRSGRRRRLPCF
ncbi:MFS transporter [Agrobacterium leguminum]|uniref:MFS transporter n=1 Tax=Agrobacterium leguminum TaxID=2792015 RepID=UPI003CE541DB